MRTRADVWKLSVAEGDWPPVLTDYAQAVGAMHELDPADGTRPTNPLGWLYQAAIHGRALANGNSDTSDPQWSNCQHGSWFFMPWHRMYLRAFEMVVQHFLGDEQWSLPYWYSIDPDHPESSVLPPAFRDDAQGNHLYTTHRSQRANRGKRLSNFSNLATSVKTALEASTFATEDGTDTFGGGRRNDPSYFGDEQGVLEDVPHGTVHVQVGNDYDPRFGPQPIRRGWMGSFSTAAQDPIFWLHHANIDRLWQMWLDADPAHTDPITESDWADTRFKFPNPNGGTPLSWTIAEVVDTAALGYRYDTTAVPSTVRTPTPVLAGGGGPLEAFIPEPEPKPPPQVVGATTKVPMNADRRTDVRLSPPAATGLEAFQEPYLRVLLRLEGITGTIAAPAYGIYLNVPPGEPVEQYPERLAGTIATFGVPEASRTDANHDGVGLTKVLDITPVRDALAEAGQWDPANLNIAFVPLIPEADDDVLEGLDAPDRPAAVSDLRASRVVVLMA